MSFTPPESTKSRTAAVQKMDCTFIQSAMSHVAHWLLLFPALSDLLSSFCSLGATVYFQRPRREVLSEMSPLSSNWEHSPQKCAAVSDWLNRSFLIPLPVALGYQSPVPGVVSSTKTASFPCVPSLKCRLADFTAAAIFKANPPPPFR